MHGLRAKACGEIFRRDEIYRHTGGSDFGREAIGSLSCCMQPHEFAPAGAQGFPHRMEAVKKHEIGMGAKSGHRLTRALSRLVLTRRPLLTFAMTRTLPSLAHACLRGSSSHAHVQQAIRPCEGLETAGVDRAGAAFAYAGPARPPFLSGRERLSAADGGMSRAAKGADCKSAG
jgi:hypothetical protein